MNKKGFTTVELILTMSIVIVIMSTITSVTYTYRDRSKHEEVITEVKNYKNSVTKIIYDDILDICKDGSGKTIRCVDGNGQVVKIEKKENFGLVAQGFEKEYFTFTTTNNKTYELYLINTSTKVGIKYNGTEYIIPGSSSSLVSYVGFELKPSTGESDLYVLDIYFSHKNLDDQIRIHLVVSK